MVAGLVALALVCGGVLIGRSASTSRSAATEAPATVTVTTAASAAPATVSESSPPTGADFARSPEGAAGAAASFVAMLGSEALLDSERTRAILDSIAARDAADGLVASFAAAAEQARRQLGVDGQPTPIVILRTTPVGYRVSHFDRDRATVDVWNVGIVGSGATVDPQQSWRTQTVSLVWEDGGWKALDFHSAPGPTPALTTTAASRPDELFTAVPDLQEFADVRP